MSLAGKLDLEKSLAFGLMACVFVYVAVRAAFVPLSFDESITFFYYIHQGECWPGIAHWDANNHILNSFLGTISHSLYGDSEFAIRLPNVLSAMLYLGFSYLISFQLKNKWPRWVLFLALIFSHFTIEFLGYTRGYGMSMALLLPAIYFIQKWMNDTTSLLYLLIGIAAMQLGTLANLSLLTINLLLWGWIPVWLLVKREKIQIAQVIIWLASSYCIYWFADLSFQMKELGLLYYGSGAGFWEITVKSLAENGFGPLAEVILVFVPITAISIVIATSLLVYQFIKKELRHELFFAYLLFASVVANLMLNWLFEVNFPEDRVGMYYLIFLPLALVFTINAVVENQKWFGRNRILAYTALLPLLLFPAGFALSMNTTHAVLWKGDSAVKDFYDEIAHRTDKGSMPTITGYHLKRIPFYYYNLRGGDRLHLLQQDAYRGDEADFQIADLKEEGAWDKYDTIAYHKPSDQYLLERKIKREKALVFSNELSPKESSADEYYSLFQGNVDSIGGKDLIWRIQVQMTDIPEPLPGWIVAEVYDKDGKSQIMVNLFTHWIRTSWKQGQIFDHTLMLRNIPEDGVYLKLYYWNIKQRPIAFGKTTVGLYEILPDKSDATLAK